MVLILVKRIVGRKEARERKISRSECSEDIGEFKAGLLATEQGFIMTISQKDLGLKLKKLLEKKRV